jgi:PAS domain S-box-containing protein
MNDRTKSTILNVNDDAVQLRVISQILRKAGWNTLEAADGTAALREARQRPDLILLDVRLPDIDGFEVCRQIKADPALADLPVVMLSAALRDDASIVAGLEGGADGYLTWPIDTAVLVSTLRAYLRARQAEEQTRFQANLVANVSDAIIATDLELRVLSWNPAAETLFGWPAEEAVGRPAHALFPSAGAGVSREMALRALRDSERWTGEALLHRRDGSAAPVYASASLIRDAAGAPAGFVVIARDIAERKRAEEALRRNEARFRAVVENSYDGIIFCDVDGRIVYRSASFNRINGFSSEERVGHSIFDNVHPDEVEELRRLWAQHLQQPEAQHRIECRVRSKDGGWLWLESAAQNLLADPNVQQIVVTSRDITKRKRDEEHYRAFFTESVTPTFWVEMTHPVPTDWPAEMQVEAIFREGVIRDVSQSLWRARGLSSKADLVGRVLVPDRDAESARRGGAIYALYDRFVRQGYRLAEHEAPEPTTAGETRWFVNSALGVVEDGHLVCIFGSFIDITERKRSEEALRESESRFSTIFRASPAPVAMTRVRDNRLVDVNPAWLELTGYARSEVIGRTPQELNLWADLAQRERMVKMILEQGQTRGEVPIRKKSGETRYLLMSAEIIELERERYLLSMGQDITERKRLEEQYLQAQKMEVVGRLAGGVAHDFNNILTAIVGYANFVKKALPAGSQVAADNEQVLRNAQRAADLTRQLLAFSRRQEIELSVVDLNSLVFDFAKMLRRLVGEDVELAVAAGQGVGRIRADRSQIQQVLMNLAVNARDAMPGGGRLLIETANATLDERAAALVGASAGEYVLLRVSDSGCGMSNEAKSHLFEPFFTTKAVGKGTGLGLATVYGIVTQHGGSIQCESELGVGTRFDIYLPRATGDVGRSAGFLAENLPRGTETILAVEDDANVRGIVARMLRSQGYHVLEATNGDEALRVAGEYAGGIDLLVTDVVMPQMGGQRLAQLLRQARPGVKVLFISGYSSDLSVGILAPEGGMHFLQKPFAPEALVFKARAVLDERDDLGAHGMV